MWIIMIIWMMLVMWIIMIWDNGDDMDNDGDGDDVDNKNDLCDGDDVDNDDALESMTMMWIIIIL